VKYNNKPTRQILKSMLIHTEKNMKCSPTWTC